MRAESVRVETFTGLRMDRFVKLVNVVRERGGNGPGGGRPWCLPLADRVLLVAAHYRTMRQLAPLFGVSPATICPAAGRRRGPAVDHGRNLDPGPRPHGRRLIRNYRFSAYVQVIIDAESRLVVASARPAPGNKGGRPRLGVEATGHGGRNNGDLGRRLPCSHVRGRAALYSTGSSSRPRARRDGRHRGSGSARVRLLNRSRSAARAISTSARASGAPRQ